MKPRTIATLCAIYNASTCPWKLRTDWEHRRHQTRAKIALRLIRAYFIEGRDYHEMSSGALWPR